MAHPAAVPVLEEIKLPPATHRIRIGEPCSASIRSLNDTVNLVVPQALMDRLRKAPKRIQLEEGGPVAYVFQAASSLKAGAKYERVGSHYSETGQTAILDMECLLEQDYDKLADAAKWCSLFQKPKGRGKDKWSNRAHLSDVRKQFSLSVVFMGDVPVKYTDRASVFVHRDSRDVIDGLIIDTGALFAVEPHSVPPPVQPSAPPAAAPAPAPAPVPTPAL